MRICSLCFLALLFTFYSSCSTAQLNWSIPLQEKFRLQYCDGESLVIQEIKTRKYGAMDVQGDVIISPSYKSVIKIKPNRFVLKNSFAQLVDGNSNVLINENRALDNIEYSLAFEVFDNDDVYYVYKGAFQGIESVDGDIILPPKYQGLYPYDEEYLGIWKNDKYGIINIKGDTIFKPIYDGVSKIEGSKLFAFKNNGSVNLIDENGRNLLQGSYFSLSPFWGNYIKAEIYKDGKRSSGILDFDENIIIDFDYKYFVDYVLDERKLLFAMTTTNTVLFDENLQPLLNNSYEKIYATNVGLKFVQNGKYGAMDINENVIIEPKYDNLSQHKNCYNGRKGNEQYILDLDGNIKLKFEDTNMSPSSNISVYTEKDLNGYFEHSGLLLTEAIYEQAYNFIQGFGKVKKNGKFGLIDSSGVEVISCEFDEISIGEDGYIVVRKNNKFGLLLLN